jgi:hypothetical protein
VKGVMGWIKSNLLIVISTVVILVSLPTGWLLSSGWNKKVRAEQEKRANDAYNKIKNARVNYVIPSLLPDEEPWSESQAPNPYLTEFVKTQREQRISQASSIVGEVESFNRDGHELLAKDLLPVPVRSGAEETALKVDFLVRMAGDTDLGRKSIYADVFPTIGAGGPPDLVKLATTIQDVQERETQRMLAEGGAGSLTPEQQDELRKLLMERRIAEAQRRAKEISLYADLSSFDPQGFGAETSIIPPAERRARGTTAPPALAEIFGWNFDYWVVSDLLRAINLANLDAKGERNNVENAAVKRIERISVKRLPLFGAGAGMGASGDEYTTESAEGADPTVSITGRVSTAAYDVVPAKLTLIVDATRIPDIIKAFAETNLMTVLDVDLSEVDVWEQLRQGYFYGSDAPVVRADLLVETVWLRSWTAQFMPADVKAALGIEETEEAPDTAEDEDGGG